MSSLRCTCCGWLWHTQADYDDHVTYMASRDLIPGQTYTRAEINALFGAPEDCTCRIVEPGHVCPSEDE